MLTLLASSLTDDYPTVASQHTCTCSRSEPAASTGQPCSCNKKGPHTTSMVMSPGSTVQPSFGKQPEQMETSLSWSHRKTELGEPQRSMDHTLPSESLVQELSDMYMPSPDSLFMYDQERQADAFLACSGPQDVNVFSGALRQPVTTDMAKCSSNMNSMSADHGLEDSPQNKEFRNMNWGSKDIEYINMDEVFQDSNDANQGPTLTQLNSFLNEGPFRGVSFQQTRVSSGKQWPSLEDWAQQSSPLQPGPQPGSSTIADSRSWTDLSNNTTSVLSDELYSSPSSSCTSNTGMGTMTVVKQEPDLPTDCPSQNIQQCYKAFMQQQPAGYNANSLYRLLLQGQLAAKQSDQGSPSPPLSPVKHRVTAATSTSKAAVCENSNSMEEKWEEIKQFLHDTGQGSEMRCSVNVKRERLDSESSVNTSHDGDLEGRDYDSPDSGDDESGQDSSDSDESLISSPTHKSKEKQYFWQYNLQSKGPKGRKLCMSFDTKDPHVLPSFEDPVFDPDYRVPGITHGGKARRGDGNNVYPNPKKLCQIGNELKKLNRRVSEYGPLNEMSSAVRNKSRKEKNKLASRACRLKKKAQHEANKVKLMGLEMEHSHLMYIISQIKEDTLKRLNSPEEVASDTLTKRLEDYINTHLYLPVAGSTTEFVNSVIQRVTSGDPKGGLDL